MEGLSGEIVKVDGIQSAKFVVPCLDFEVTLAFTHRSDELFVVKESKGNAIVLDFLSEVLGRRPGEAMLNLLIDASFAY